MRGSPRVSQEKQAHKAPGDRGLVLELTREELRRRIERGDLRIAVYGLGRIGLPLAVAWLRAGQRVMGVDIDRETVEKINMGASPIQDEPGIPEAVSEYTSKGRFQATTDLVRASEESDVKLVAVPTTLKEGGGFNSEPLERALRGIGRGLKRGDGVSIECTVPPTTTSGLARRILEEESGLEAEREFALAYSPERVYEGRILRDLEENYPKIVGGLGPKSTELFSTLYRRIARKGVIEMSTPTAAELSKLFEGVYRDVNIALANELAELCQALDIDFMEVREASNSQPYCHLHKPGVGVGGPCIPVYPYFIIEKANDRGLPMPLTRIAREINEEMPKRTVNLIVRALEKFGGKVQGVRVAILGLAFRGDIADARNSPTYSIASQLKSLGADVVVHDPYLKEDGHLRELGIPLTTSLEEAVGKASIVVIATDHKEYADKEFTKIIKLSETPIILFDGRGIIDPTKIQGNLYFTGIGRRRLHLAVQGMK
ncbi:MAG: nucleotide sugar dehydrogenase [Candidatus Bathyarchaeia archaeon]